MIVKHMEDGKVLVEAFSGGWRTYGTPLDALIGECQVHLGIINISKGVMGARERLELGLDCGTMSRVRNNVQPIPNNWLLRFHVWSGLPLRVVESLANQQSKVQPRVKLEK